METCRPYLRGIRLAVYILCIFIGAYAIIGIAVYGLYMLIITMVDYFVTMIDFLAKLVNL